jgi:hypothetical protein
MTPLDPIVASRRDKPGIIYIAKNKVNGKCYVGQTTKGLNRRRRDHIWDAKNGAKFIFHYAIKKYGEDAFEFYRLLTCRSNSTSALYPGIGIRHANLG